MISMRVVLGLGFGMALVGVLAAIIFGTYISISAIDAISGMESQAWMIAVFVSCLIGGFGLLMALSSLTIASAIWKMNKVLLWILVGGLAISMISAGVVSATAAKFSSVFVLEREKNYSSVDIQLPENLEGVKYVKASEDFAPYTITVDARSNTSEGDSKITAKLKYLNINNKTEAPKVHVERVDDTLVVGVDGKKYCYGGVTFFDTDCLTRDYIIEFHGPVTYRYDRSYENEIPEVVESELNQ